MRYGVLQARRGGLTKDDVANAVVGPTEKTAGETRLVTRGYWPVCHCWLVQQCRHGAKPHCWASQQWHTRKTTASQRLHHAHGGPPA